MWNRIKKTIRRLTPNKIKEFFAYQEGDEYAIKVYSQEGEDIFLKRIFEHSPPGFYVDVGAHHPFRFSNTKLLYDMGWRGINIEPNPDVIELFQKYRPEDIHIPMGLSMDGGTLKYYRFRHPALNTFSEDHSRERIEKPISTENIETTTLSKVLTQHLPKGREIDLLSIDAEGMDFEILQSMNWNLHKPRMIIVEAEKNDLTSLLDSDLHNLMISKGYYCSSILNKSAIYELQ